jgi:hypothetical protein
MSGLLKNHLGSKRFDDDEDVEMEVRKWLKQQSKDFYVAGLDAMAKQWDKCINVGGGYFEKWTFFFFIFEYHVFCVLHPFVTYLLTLLHRFLSSHFS